MDILLDEDLLVFSREEMLEESVIRCRDGKKFEHEVFEKRICGEDISNQNTGFKKRKI